MTYSFEPIQWDNRLAFNKDDCTIRVEAKDDIPWGNEKWQTTNCCTRKAGTQTQIWDNDKKELVWVKTPDVIFFGGLSTEEQEALVPIIARGLPALFIRASRCNNRGRWYIEREEDVCNYYQSKKEDGVPYNDSEYQGYINEIADMFTEDSARIMKHLPSGLYDVIELAVRNYTGINITIEHSTVEMCSMLLCDEEKDKRRIINKFLLDARDATFTDVGRLIKELPLKKNGKKAFIEAMHRSRLFDTEGKTKEQYYKSISEGF